VSKDHNGGGSITFFVRNFIPIGKRMCDSSCFSARRHGPFGYCRGAVTSLAATDAAPTEPVDTMLSALGATAVLVATEAPTSTTAISSAAAACVLRRGTVNVISQDREAVLYITAGISSPLFLSISIRIRGPPVSP
jgi:hypothetical protein